MPGRMHSLQAAFAAWQRCKPRGVTIPREQADVLRVLRELLREQSSGEEGVLLLDQFEPEVRGLLDAAGQDVGFLLFWRIVSTLWHACGGAAGPLFLEELETLRDDVLRELGALEGPGDRHLDAQAFQRMAVRSRAMSAEPEAWTDFIEFLPPDGQLQLSDVAVIWLPFLQDASERVLETPDLQDQVDEAKPNTVRVHIYDVSDDETIAKINRFFAPAKGVVKFGGVFHAGIEVYGLEWAYGCTQNDTVAGVHTCLPKEHEMHTYRQSVVLGETHFSPQEVGELMTEMLEAWPGTEYNLLHRNCCTFADTLARVLGVRRIPRWVHRFAKIGASVDTTVTTISGYVNTLRDTVKSDKNDGGGRNYAFGGIAPKAVAATGQ